MATVKEQYGSTVAKMGKNGGNGVNCFIRKRSGATKREKREKT